MWKFIRNLTLPAAALGMALFAIYHLLYAEQPMPKLTPPAPPASIELSQAIAATGLIEPVTEKIALGSAQNGIVVEAMFTSRQAGQQVRRGEPLFHIDDRAWQAQRKVHLANLKAAEAELTKLQQLPRAEDVPPLEAKVSVAESRLADARDRHERILQVNDISLSRDELMQRRFAKQTAENELQLARTELTRIQAGAWEPDLAIARAAVEVARANLQLTETEIERCIVRAPIDGELLSVNVRVGEYVSNNSTALMEIGDLTQVNVRVSVDEEDLSRFQPGRSAWGIPRGNARTKWQLRFVRVEPLVIPKKVLTGAGDERVDTRVAQVIYQFEKIPTQVFIGQQLDVFIDAKPE